MFGIINWKTCWKFAIVITTICLLNVNAEDRVCLRCDNLPHPRDCDRVVVCSAGESCFVEQVVTESGNIVYNSGCASQQKCQSFGGRKRAVRYSGNVQEQLNSISNLQIRGESSGVETSVDEIYVDVNMEDPIVACFKCCNSSNYCNRNLCDPEPVEIPVNQTLCLSCATVADPTQCEFLVMCNPNEICYTEFMNLNGEERYRMGCISQDACSKGPQPTIQAPSLVGKRRFIMDIYNDSLTKYCSKCCSDRVGNCNRELCPKTGTAVPTGIEVSELINPPERKDLCTDALPDACNLYVTQFPENCKKSIYANYACRETCGTCVNPGHMTPMPTGTTTSETSKVPPTDCFYDSKRYMGAVSTTVTGKTCLNWADLDPKMQGMPDGSSVLAGSYCRDPDGRGFPWCFTSSLDWEFCPVKYCQECFYPGKSVNYQGYVSVDVDNNTCSPWVDNLTSSKGTLTDSSFPDNSSSDAKNYCRDPYETGRPQCYVGGTLKNCSVPQCTTNCMDNSETNCSIVQQYVCKFEYTQATLCPKTCSMCKFGLLPPVYKQPPPDNCLDNPDANCPVLKSIICDDPIGAQQLCPKTCKKCNLLYTTSSPPILSSTTSVKPTTQSTSKMTSPMTSIASTITQVITVSHTQTTTAAPTVTNTQTTTPAPTTKPYWLSWESWQCHTMDGACYRVRYRNCSTYNTNDCEHLYSGTSSYNIDLCSPSTCPDYYKSTTVATTTFTTVATTTPQEACHDAAGTPGCQDPGNLETLCKEKSVAWTYCAKSCNLCDTCWDYLDTCNTTTAKQLFCRKEEFEIQYCRETCGKCDHKPVAVEINSCGDPVKDNNKCDVLQKGICICKDDDVKVLCKNYCAGKCAEYPTIDNTCTPARRRKRDEFLQEVLFKRR